jgi:hypothetical protein
VAAVTKEIVLITLAIDTATGEIDAEAPFMVNSRRRGPRYNRPYEDERGVIEQFRPGECPQAQASQILLAADAGSSDDEIACTVAPPCIGPSGASWKAIWSGR